MFKEKSTLMFVLVFIFILSVVPFTYAQKGNALKITTHELAYANMYRDIKVPSIDSILTLQYKIKAEHISGYSFGGAVFFYWGPKEYAGLRIDSSVARTLRADIAASKVKTGTFAMTNGWLEVKVVVTLNDVFFYVRGLDDEEWTLFYREERLLSLLTKPSGIVIGTGYDTAGDVPYLRKSHSTELRGVGSLYITDIIISAGDEVIFREDFNKTVPELMLAYDVASDPNNKEPVFEIIELEE